MRADDPLKLDKVLDVMLSLCIRIRALEVQIGMLERDLSLLRASIDQHRIDQFHVDNRIDDLVTRLERIETLGTPDS